MFQEIGAKFVMFAEEWADWYQSPCPEEEALPGDFVTAGEMQTLCIVRVLRPDRITFALRKFVAGFLGEDFVSQPPFSMRSVYEDSSASTPILFLLFPGVDPSAWVEDLGREMGITTSSEMLSNTSMGEQVLLCPLLCCLYAWTDDPTRHNSAHTNYFRRNEALVSTFLHAIVLFPHFAGVFHPQARARRRKRSAPLESWQRRAGGSCCKTCTSCSRGCLHWS